MKTLLNLLIALAANLTAFAGVDLGTPSSYTPYDRFLSPVRTVMGSLGGKSDQPSMEQVKAFMKVGRSFRYHLDDPYIPASPATTARIKEGDCKDKALWLADQLNDPSIRFVIGKTSKNAKISHAWLMWQSEGRWWVLDCTLKTAPIAADTLPADKYIPQYSYSRNGSYRHASTAVNVATVAVANAPVAAK